MIPRPYHSKLTGQDWTPRVVELEADAIELFQKLSYLLGVENAAQVWAAVSDSRVQRHREREGR